MQRKFPPARIGFKRRGSTIILTMIFLALFASLAVAFHVNANMSVRKAHNYTHAQNAQLAAESGVAFMLGAAERITMSATAADEDLLLGAANALAEQMDDTANMGDGEIMMEGNTVFTPVISAGNDGRAFQIEITEDPATQELWMTSTGHWKGVSKRIRMRLDPQARRSVVLDYGIASKGKIVLGGDGTVLGLNDPNEASVFSATFSDDEAVEITGSCTLGGDISTANPDSYVTIKGKPIIGGTSDPSEYGDHINIGVGNPEFPEVDPTVFEPYATNVLPIGADTSSDIVLENIRIPAGMNPKFSAKVTIRGVVYVEQPNDITFTGQTEIIGVIATQDAGEDVFEENKLKFTGNVSCEGVEALPDEPQFQELREMPGTMIMAPGFGVEFTGSFEALNGAIIAEKFSMTGNAGGIVRGPILCYGDTNFELLGSSEVHIDRQTYAETPAGLRLPVQLVPLPETYQEN